MFNFELTLILKATVLLAAGIAIARALGGARAAVRHMVLACSFAAVAALPLASAVMPGVSIEIPAGEAVRGSAATLAALTRGVGQIAAPVAVPPASDAVMLVAPRPAQVLRAIWVAGTAAMLGWLAIGTWQFSRLRREGLPALDFAPEALDLARGCGITRSVSLLTHERVVAPLTCGLRRTTILLPMDATEWTPGERRRALVHELEHVRRFDWAVQMMARLVCAWFWFHPLAWVAWRQLRLDAERACDDAVVRQEDTADYAEQLVDLARRLSGAESNLTLAMAGRSDLSRRVRSLLDARQRRGPVGIGTVAATASAFAIALTSLAPLQAIEAADGETLSLVDLVTGDGQSRGGRSDASLYRAASRGNLTRMVELIDTGADVNQAIDGDGSPLIGAARAGHYDAVKLLLDRGADPNFAVEGDGNPLIMAAREGHVEIVKLLLDRGAYIDQVVVGDETALIQASAEGRAATVRLLLERGANPNVRVWAEAIPGKEGEWRSALSQARRGGHTAVMQMLIAAGARQ